MDGFQNWDIKTFHLINETWANPVFNALLPWTREKFLWIPLYLFFIYLWIKQYSWKGLYLIAFLLLTIALSDLLSAHWIKFAFHRLRPCQNLHLIGHIISRIDCGSGFSFVSSHASNHFAIAAFIGLWLRKYYPYGEPLMYLWAGIISYAQVYVGVHYPLDILSGALLGLIIGWTISYWTLWKGKF
jgi:undecaprenyl-diphosphatase